MTPRVPNGTGLLRLPASLILMVVLASVPASGLAAEPFSGYPGKVREQAVRVVWAASPNPTEAYVQETRTLRKQMFRHGILSVNAVPDLVFERARKEGWTGEASGALRETARVAPLSVPLWAWLLRDDVLRIAPHRLLSDAAGLAGAVRAFVPALPGSVSYLLSLFSAAACWFAAWASISLLLRARAPLTADVARLFRTFPHPGIPAALAVWICFTAPVLAGAGLGACAVFWIALSAGYLRRGELAIAATAIFLLLGVFLAGGVLGSLDGLAAGSRAGAWVGVEGYFPRPGPDPPAAGDPSSPGSRWGGMVRFGKARAEMQAGNLAESERIWSELIRAEYDLAGSYNNRGIVRARLGRTDEALTDFEAAVARTPSGGPAHWNAYQLYLGSFRLEKAARIQSAAWSSIGNLPPFDIRAEEMARGELVPSPLRAERFFADLFLFPGGFLREAARSPVHALFFRLLPGAWIPAFLAAGICWAAAWFLLSRKVWLHCACRACGALTMVARAKETTDVCNSCRAMVGAGVRGGEERERRILNVRLHRRYVRVCSVLLPGSGALWAGKEFRAMAYGFALSIPLGALTVSLGARSASRGMIPEMQALFAGVAAACAVLVWAAGARWGWRSFDALQRQHNVAQEGM